MRWSGSIENDGHIEKALGKVQNVIGIICCSIGCIFLTSSWIRNTFTVKVMVALTVTVGGLYPWRHSNSIEYSSQKPTLGGSA